MLSASRSPAEKKTNRSVHIPPPYLQFLAVFVVDGHDHLDILGLGFVPLVEIPKSQSHVDVVPNITFRKTETSRSEG